MTKGPPFRAGGAARKDRTYQEHQHDTYKARGKLKEPTACPQCGAVFHKGRWTWETRPPGAHDSLCPACHRIRDKYPQGILTIAGPFLLDHKEEILGVVRNTEAKEKAEHPLSRIMSIEQQGEALVVATTDTHLPRGIGETLHHAYEGDFSFHYDEGEQFIREKWAR